MKVGIVGVGKVGSAVQHGLTRIGHEVHGYDTKMPETSLKDILPTEIVFVCVPTPQCEDGSCNVSIVEKVVSDLSDAKYAGLVVIKSTIEPGTVDRLSEQHSQLRLAFCPEFLRERAMYVDFVENHDICIIGAYTDEDAELVRKVHGVLPKQFAILTPLEAEFAKYFLNVFNALRIVYANQFYDVCKAAGADYQKVKDAIAHHRNVQDVYLDCNENFRGFGGACLPKDTSAFAHFTRKMLDDAQDNSLFDQIVKINKRYKPTVF